MFDAIIATVIAEPTATRNAGAQLLLVMVSPRDNARQLTEPGRHGRVYVNDFVSCNNNSPHFVRPYSRPRPRSLRRAVIGTR